MKIDEANKRYENMELGAKYLVDEWKVIEKGFDSERNMASESVFCLGNGFMCMRGFFEEGYPSDNTTRSTFIAGFYEELPNSYDIVRPNAPLSYKKIVNTTDWAGIKLTLDGESYNMLDSKIEDFVRTLDMREGILERSFIWEDSKGRRTSVTSHRFVSMYNHKTAAFRFIIKPLNYLGKFRIDASLNADLTHKAFYSGKLQDSIFQEIEKGSIEENGAYLVTRTNKSGLSNASTMFTRLFLNGSEISSKPVYTEKDMFANLSGEVLVKDGDVVVFEKHIGVATSRELDKSLILQDSVNNAKLSCNMGYDEAYRLHKDAWSKIWETADVEIRGDVEAQQGVRFCNFHIMQSYSGKDDTITIACKGITAEVYNGGYFWDAEVLAFPLFLFLNPDTARSILKFRYNTLDIARERAKQFRYRGSVYPWVTVNGTEDCNQWAYAEGEIHNNGCIPWAIYRYVDVTGDIDYLSDYGAEVLIEEARFWSDRVNYSEYRKGYVLNCVCGPDEYQVAVSNNYYTNYLARFTLQYAIEAIEIMKGKYPEKWVVLSDILAFNDNEASKWKDIIEKLLLPYDAKRNIFIQDDEYLSRAEFEPKAVPRDELPIYKNWPWENTMRFNIIKQPDVLMLFHLLSERFDQETKKSNCDFYESQDEY